MTVDEIKQLLRIRLSDKRYYHSLCVADSARELAKRNGYDEEKAYFAGLVHDITKETDSKNQLQMITEFGIILDNVEQKVPKLWHAISGYVFLQTNCGVTDTEILDAVRYHTTARANMTMLDKILYLADYISADRDYDGVEQRRKDAKISLEYGIIGGLRFTICDLVERNCTVHSDTIDAYNDIILKNEG